MNLRIYIIKSLVSSTPLAEVRTDGRVLEFLVDNTEGKLPRMVGKQLSNLMRLVKHSSHLRLEQPQKPTTNVLRYVMNNGDVVEITTDGETCLLNGQLLSEEERQALFDAIRSGEISIKQKADLRTPIPVIPMIHQSSSQTQAFTPPKLDMGLINYMKEQQEIKRKDRLNNNHYHDSELEKMDFSDTQSPAMAKQMMYLLRYGKTKGEDPNA